jgi:hypothetical protein
MAMLAQYYYNDMDYILIKFLDNEKTSGNI